LVRVGEAVRYVHPRSKAAVLNAVRQSGFTKDDLREMEWSFSGHLWNAGSLGGSYDEFRRDTLALPRSLSLEGHHHLEEETMTTTRTVRTRTRRRRPLAKRKDKALASGRTTRLTDVSNKAEEEEAKSVYLNNYLSKSEEN